MNRQSVESSNLRSVGYDPASGTLEVEFRSGVIWQYSDVPAELFQEMEEAESRGSFFHRNVRSKFEGKRLTPTGVE